MHIRCCNKCTKRALGCHSHCKDYNDERNILDERNKKIRNKKVLEYDFIAYHTKKIARYQIAKNKIKNSAY